MRLVRHYLPERIVRFLLLRSLVIQPGLETRDPQAAIHRYVNVLSERNDSLSGKRVMVFGYGGRFDLGVGLLEAGADSVILCEKYAPPDDAHNRTLLPRYETHLLLDGERVRPRNERITLLEADIRDVKPTEIVPVDLIISSSVYEHLDDVEDITQSLAALTKPDGLHIHFIDLRDHYFIYPFEMLAYSEHVWKSFLNPTSNLNRLRLRDYERIFNKSFQEVDTLVLERCDKDFEEVRKRIRPEFLTGDTSVDSVALIRVIAQLPIRQDNFQYTP